MKHHLVLAKSQDFHFYNEGAIAKHHPRLVFCLYKYM